MNTVRGLTPLIACTQSCWTSASCSQQRCWALLCSSGTVIVLNHCYAVSISLTVALHSLQSKHENTVEYRDAVARSCEVQVSAATKLWKVFLTRDTKVTTRWDFLYSSPVFLVHEPHQCLFSTFSQMFKCPVCRVTGCDVSTCEHQNQNKHNYRFVDLCPKYF